MGISIFFGAKSQIFVTVTTPASCIARFFGLYQNWWIKYYGSNWLLKNLKDVLNFHLKGFLSQLGKLKASYIFDKLMIGDISIIINQLITLHKHNHNNPQYARTWCTNSLCWQEQSNVDLWKSSKQHVSSANSSSEQAVVE